MYCIVVNVVVVLVIAKNGMNNLKMYAFGNKCVMFYYVFMLPLCKHSKLLFRAALNGVKCPTIFTIMLH